MWVLGDGMKVWEERGGKKVWVGCGCGFLVSGAVVEAWGRKVGLIWGSFVCVCGLLHHDAMAPWVDCCVLYFWGLKTPLFSSSSCAVVYFVRVAVLNIKCSQNYKFVIKKLTYPLHVIRKIYNFTHKFFTQY